MRNSRRGEIDPFIVMDVMEAARAAEAAGRHIIHMEVGQPGTGAPAAALSRLAADMQDEPLGYTVGLGLPELRARIAQHYRDWYDIDVDAGRIVVTAGASGAFLLAFSALFDTGARVGLGAPCYPSYRQILKAMDMVPVDMPTTLAARMQPVAADVAAHDLNGLIVASPANPTGTMLGRTEMADLAAACAAADAAFISDEIYHGLGYHGRCVSALEVTDEVIVINSFSKYFSMTGWRVGWMVVPEDQVRRIERLAQNMFICPSHASQRLALYAMDCAETLDAHVDVYRTNRDLMMEALPQMGLGQFAPPDGAFYVYVDVGDYTSDSLEFCAQVLEKAGVAITPGLDFDPVEGGHWVRLSYARSTQDIREGLARLADFMAGLRAED
ncbi:pyridoxal phosphate-dependent aminotransferase [Pseudooctadecabacter jejudonensis]|uniref:Aminotransferase n=1 Tax=Pseudooctadecabacter jejudonensis TaxID=1391910 RepID=A0A1Y5RAS8_9RHOB|nr:aminotransferase class I/II-fold pyridoxal phosphate-dependent enzyme [Pseudooctadecabacter jejudonensis]SLN11957.1 Aspartate aminotransferase [Pseudooctadecabacter jejudonensis]